MLGSELRGGDSDGFVYGIDGDLESGDQTVAPRDPSPPGPDGRVLRRGCGQGCAGRHRRTRRARPARPDGARRRGRAARSARSCRSRSAPFVPQFIESSGRPDTREGSCCSVQRTTTSVADRLVVGRRDDDATVFVGLDRELLADLDPSPLDNGERKRDLALRRQAGEPLPSVYSFLHE